MKKFWRRRMFLAFVLGSNGPASGVFQPLTPQGMYQNEFTSLKDAKDGVEKLLVHQSYRSYFQNGYSAYIVDAKNNQLASVAVIPKQPAAVWKDLS